jgi:hypothetical protein
MELRKVGRGNVAWILLPQDRNQWPGSCEHCNEPESSIKGGELFEVLTFKPT